MVFKFLDLATELALEIIRLAVMPRLDPQDEPSCSRPYYATALSLASVSYAIRQATMPHLLHTVVLSSQNCHDAFIRSIILQQSFKNQGSRLALDYTSLVQRFWSSRCWPPVVDEQAEDRLNYNAIYEIIKNVQSIGLNFDSLHLLYNALSIPNAQAPEDWSCQRVTFAGNNWRWKPLTSTPEGLAFLRRITHLTLWISSPDLPSSDQENIPSWVHHVPFALMPALTHFAYPLSRTSIPHQGSFQAPTEMIVYIVPHDSNTEPLNLPQWLFSPDPQAHGTVVPFRTVLPLNCNKPEDLFWERVYLQGEPDTVWTKAGPVRLD